MSDYIQSCGYWNFVKELGSGAFGNVTLWKHIENGNLVAVKTCRARPAELNQEMLIKLKQRWNNEVSIMSKIVHQNFVHACPELCPDLLESINKTIETKLPAIAMEFCEAGSLRDKLEKMENINGLSEFECSEVLRALKDAVFYLHAEHKITHRDIKPDNIVITVRMDGKVIYKLADVGYARLIDENTIQASMVGTKNYFAPEIVNYAKYKNSVDYWSMGVLAFEIISGVHPFLPGETFCNAMLAIEKKPPGCIAITKGLDNTLTHENTLPSEGRQSAKFRELIAPWLALALEKDGRKRGYDASGQFKFYTALQAVLDTRILTIFWINKLRFLSYNLAEFQTTRNLYERIYEDTCSSGKNVYLFFPVGHACAQLGSVRLNMHPSQLFDEQIFRNDKPMLYLVTFVENSLCNPDDPFVCNITRQLFAASNESLTGAFLHQGMLAALFMHQNEQKRCFHYLNGLNELVMNVEDSACKLKPLVREFNAKVHEYNGQALSFETIVTAGRQLIEQTSPGGNAEFEACAKGFKSCFPSLSNIFIRCDNTHSRIRDLIQRLQSSPVATASQNISLQVKKFEECSFNRRPDRKNSGEIIEMVNSANVALLTKRKEFIDAVRSCLTVNAANGVTYDALSTVILEYLDIVKDFEENQKPLHDAQMEIVKMTENYMKQSVRPKEKPLSVEYQSLVAKMQTLDCSEMSTEDILHQNDELLKYATECFDHPMEDDS